MLTFVLLALGEVQVVSTVSGCSSSIPEVCVDGVFGCQIVWHLYAPIRDKSN